VDPALVEARAVGGVVHAQVVAAPERDVARSVLVEERVVEDGLHRADAALAVDERELAEPGRAVVLLRQRAQRVGAAVGVELDGAARLELDADPVDQRAVDLERPRGRHVAVDPERIGGREHLLARDVREVAEPVDGGEVGGVPDRRGEEPHRQVRPRPVQPDRVEAPLGHPRRRALERRRPRAPRLLGVRLVESADVRDRLPQPVEGLVAPELGKDEPRPARRGSGGDAPVRRRAVDDVAGVREVRQDVAAGARGLDPVERVGRRRPVERDPRRALVGQPLEPLRHPRGDVVERLGVGVEQALALQPGIEDRDVDPARAALVRRARHLARQRLLADVGRDTHDLAGLDVRAVADDQVGEAARELGVLRHARQGSDARMAPCA
jgi:hypothetical protein